MLTIALQGNKGATAVRFTLYNSTVLTFINTHLAAFDEFIEKRNADYHELVRRVIFSPVRSEPSGEEDTQTPESLFQTDALFWMASEIIR